MAARTIFIALVVALAARAEGTSSLARLLPAGTPLYLEVQPPTAEEQSQLVLARAYKDKDLQAMVETLGGGGSMAGMSEPMGPARISLRGSMAGPDLGVDVIYTDVRGERVVKVRSRIAIAVVGLLDGAFPVDAVVAVEVDSDPNLALETLMRIGASASLQQRGQLLGDVDEELQKLFREMTHRGQRIVAARVGPVALHAAAVGRFLVVATSEARIRDIVDRHLDATPDCLATEPRHQAAVSLGAGTGTCTTLGVLRLDRVLDLLTPRFPQAAAIGRGVLMQLGLDTVRTVVVNSRVDGTGTTSTASLVMEGPPRGMAKLFAPTEPGKFPGIEFAPKETLYVTCGRFNPGELLGVARESYGFLVLGMEEQIRRRLQMDVGKDLLERLGPEGALIIAPTHGLIPDVGLVIDVREPEPFIDALLRLVTQLPWAEGAGPVSVRLCGVAAYTLPLGRPEFGMTPIAPTFGIVDGKLLITPFPLTFQRFVGVKQGQRPSIRENPDYVSLRARVPKEAIAFSYLDFPRLIASYYDTFMPLMQAMPQGTGDIYQLPDIAVFAKHMYGRIAWRIVDERGVHWVSHSAMDTLGFFAGAIGAMTGWVAAQQASSKEPFPMPAEAGTGEGRLPRDRESALCEANVRVLRARMMLCKQQSGNLPASLEELRAAHIHPRTFQVPGAESGYTYLGPVGQGKVLLFGAANGADAKITVLTADFQILRVTAEELSAMRTP